MLTVCTLILVCGAATTYPAKAAAQNIPEPVREGEERAASGFAKYFSLTPHALVQHDLAFFDAGSGLSSPDFSSGTNFRRAQIGVSGGAFTDWSYYLLLDFSSAVEKADYIYTAYIEYDGLKPLGFRVGAYAPPAGIEDSTGSADLIFPERPAASDIARNIAGAPSREAATLFVQDRTHLAALSYTLGKVGDGRLSEQQQGLVGRLAWLAYEDSDAAVLLDADASYVLKLPDSAAGRVTRLTIQPEFTVGNLRLVDTGPIEASHIAEWQFESVAAWRNLYAQAGYFRYRVTRRASLLPDPDFEGWYGLMTWVLTGERRSYDPSTASFRAPRPQSPLSGGTGVWELALRYSAIDLEDDGAPAIAFGDAIHGGRQNVRNFAINWYPTRHLHLALTHEWIEVKRFAGNGSGLGGSSSATMLRSQIAF